MNQKVNLTELAHTADVKAARAEPIHRESRSMDFIRSIILDIPIQVMVETNTKVEPVVDADDGNMADIRRLAGLTKI